MTKPDAPKTDTAKAASSNRLKPDRPAADKPLSTDKGDLPTALLDRYLIERDRKGRPEQFFRDTRSTEPAFRDRGRSLETRQAYPDTIGDMLKIAEHRGWRRLKVEGDEAFRRDVWIQAQARGLDVSGYRPRQRDRQAAGQSETSPSPETPWIRALKVAERLLPDPETRRRVIHAVLARARDDGRDRSRSQDRELRR